MRRLPIVLATSNGTGMGHLARQISIALSLTARSEPLIFSMSPAVPIIAEHGLRGEYCPSYDRSWMPHSVWHSYLHDRVLALLRETGARVFVFDGVAPYPGLLRARLAAADVAFVWFRRGFWRPGTPTRALRARPFFDLVIEPGELASDADLGPTASLTDSIVVPPITLQEVLPPLSRHQAAAALGLDPDRRTVLITLGSGHFTSSNTAGFTVIRTILECTDWQIALTQSPLGNGGVSGIDPERVVELHNLFPLSRYLATFDAAVSAAGYNTFHELLFGGIPALFVPNSRTGTDNQVTRARWAADNGFALAANERQLDYVAMEVTRLCDRHVRADLVAACRELPRPRGAAAAADTLLDTEDQFRRHRPGRAERRRVIDLTARAIAARLLGQRGTALFRTALGRRPHARLRTRLAARLFDEFAPEGRTRATKPTSTPADATHGLILTDRLTHELIQSGVPIEHVIAGSSSSYRQQRRSIIDQYYDLES